MRSGHTDAPIEAEQLPIWILRFGKCLRTIRAYSIMYRLFARFHGVSSGTGSPSSSSGMPPFGPDSCQIITWSIQVDRAILSLRSFTKCSSPDISFVTILPSGPFSLYLKGLN